MKTNPAFLFLVFLVFPFFAQFSGAATKGDPDCGKEFAKLAAEKDPLAAYTPPDFDYRTSNLWNYTVTWELLENFSKFREDPGTVMLMPIIHVPETEVQVIEFHPISRKLVKKFHPEKGTVYWPLHPNNTEPSVPYMGMTPIATIETRYTASRSLLSVESDTPAFSIKAGTNFPHKAELQTAKAFTKDDVDGALLRQPFINAMEKILPEDDILLTVPEVMILRHEKSGEGVLIRDLSKLDRPDRIYVTGLSIPYKGREIAEKNGAGFEEFWTRAYSENLGRAKARLLINYGLEMETPNSQNILIEFTSDFKPTGRVVIRDTVDSYPYKPWLEATGMEKVEAENVRLDYKPKTSLNPYADNSHWRFNEAGEQGFSDSQVAAMNKAHDQAWIDEIKKLLGVEKELKDVEAVNKFLSSEEGKKAIRDYHQRIGTLPEMKKIDDTLYPHGSGMRMPPFRGRSPLYSPSPLGYAWA